MSAGTKDDPWVLKTPPGSSEYTMYRDDAADPPVIVCQVGSTQLKYLVGAWYGTRKGYQPVIAPQRTDCSCAIARKRFVSAQSPQS
jgi:hypothetical protein